MSRLRVERARFPHMSRMQKQNSPKKILCWKTETTCGRYERCGCVNLSISVSLSVAAFFASIPSSVQPFDDFFHECREGG